MLRNYSKGYDIQINRDPRNPIAGKISYRNLRGKFSGVHANVDQSFHGRMIDSKGYVLKLNKDPNGFIAGSLELKDPSLLRQEVIRSLYRDVASINGQLIDLANSESDNDKLWSLSVDLLHCARDLERRMLDVARTGFSKLVFKNPNDPYFHEYYAKVLAAQGFNEAADVAFDHSEDLEAKRLDELDDPFGFGTIPLETE